MNTSRLAWTVILAVCVGGCGGSKPLILSSTMPRKPVSRSAPVVSNRPVVASAATKPTVSNVSGALTQRSRRAWTSASPVSNRLDPMGVVTRITVHHSGEANEMMSETQIVAQLERYRASQCSTTASGGLGAGDLAYHFVIDRRGVVWEGRSLQYQGAHAGNGTANRGNIGICLLGNFGVQSPNPDQERALKDLLLKLMGRFHVKSSYVYTHREVKALYGLPTTECPGRHLQAYMEKLRYQFRTTGR